MFLQFAQDFDLNAVSTDNLYLVEPMICIGLIDKQPSSMNNDYRQILMKLVSFKSKRTNGTFANSLEVNNDYAPKTVKMDPESDNYSEQWYMGPLSIQGDKVIRKNLSGRNDDLNLKITSRTVKNGKVTHELSGTYGLEGTVVGSYKYNMKCTATVVTEPSRRDDNTSRK